MKEQLSEMESNLVSGFRLMQGKDKDRVMAIVASIISNDNGDRVAKIRAIADEFWSSEKISKL